MHRLRPRNHLPVSAAIAAAAFAAAAASPAAGQGCTGQAGTSALEQYCEAVPRADGGRDKADSIASSRSSSDVSASTSRRLRAAGADGAAVEALTGSSRNAAPTAQSPGEPKKGSATAAYGSSAETNATPTRNVEGPADPSSNPLKAATKAAEAGPVAGPALVWTLLGLGGIGAVAAVVLRKRDRLASPGDDSDV